MWVNTRLPLGSEDPPRRQFPVNSEGIRPSLTLAKCQRKCVRNLFHFRVKNFIKVVPAFEEAATCPLET